MSDQPKPPADAPKDAVPAPEVGPRADLAGHLPAKATTWTQQVFIWTMIILVGIIFGIGPSAGLMMQNPGEIAEYKVDLTEVQRRQRIATLLQDILRVRFAKGGYDRDPNVTYARDIRKAMYAKDLGLMPSGKDLDRLVDAFMARKVGERTYAEIFKDNRRSQELSNIELKLWISEEFAIKALNAREVASPLVPVAAGATLQTMNEEKFIVDEVVLSAKSLLPEVKADDPEIAATYDKLKNDRRFAVTPSTTVQVVAADIEALAQAHAPGDDQVKAYYDAHLADYAKPMPPLEAGKEAPKEAPKTEYLPLAEVAEGITATLRRQAALAQAKPMVEAFEQTVEAQKLDEKDAAAFTSAAQAAKLVVTEMEVAETRDDAIDLGRFGTLTQKFRLHSAKPGTITSMLFAQGEMPILLRVGARHVGSVKPLSDPEVVKLIREELAGQRAYAQLLTEVEKIRAAAEAAGPGGLRTVLGSDEAKKRWETTVETKDLGPLTDLTPPAPAGDGVATPREPRALASLATSTNPVLLVEADKVGSIPAVKLVQVVGIKAPPAAEAAAKAMNAQRIRTHIDGMLDRQADLAIDTKLKSGG